MTRKPELLAPAGSREALVAAVQNGADAVYLGAGHFNARQTAAQFSGEVLREAVRYCHARGVRVYVTLNTLVREDETDALCEDIRMVAEAHADAVLVQDFGVLRLVRQMVPQLPIHASTQMAVHNRAGVEFLVSQGITRVVLAREMSFDEIADCTGLGAELEVFAHGALCVACSGQCLLSSMIGGRSGNRGRCAQPCRRKYRLGSEEGYLLSTKDLCALEHCSKLAELGVDSLKLEGRLKRPEYVAVVTGIYRNALDGKVPENAVNDLKQMFNRGGFTHSYLTGLRESALMYHERPNHLGVEVGFAMKNGLLRADVDLIGGDVLVLRNEREDKPIEVIGRKDAPLSCPTAKKGDRLVRLVSEAQMEAARKSYAEEKRLTAIEGRLTLKTGEPAKLEIRTEGLTCQAEGCPVDVARHRPPDRERMADQLRKTGDTPYRWSKLELDVDEDAFVPVSVLNALRRDALEKLTDAREIVPYTIFTPKREEGEPYRNDGRIALSVQSSSPEALKLALEMGADLAVFAPDDVRSASLDAVLDRLPAKFALMLPPVLRRETLEMLHHWAQTHRDRIAATYRNNIAHFAMEWPGRCYGAEMLNCASLSAEAQLSAWGCERVTPSVELTAQQIRRLTRPRECIVHGALPLMQLRHCPYRAANGMKGAHDACRRCDQTDQGLGALIDEKGAAFPLKRLATDCGCLLRLYNSAPLMLLRKAGALPPCDAWRLILETSDEVRTWLPLYRAAADGQLDKTKLPDARTTTGHYFRGVE